MTRKIKWGIGGRKTKPTQGASVHAPRHCSEIFSNYLRININQNWSGRKYSKIPGWAINIRFEQVGVRKLCAYRRAKNALLQTTDGAPLFPTVAKERPMASLACCPLNCPRFRLQRSSLNMLVKFTQRTGVHLVTINVNVMAMRYGLREKPFPENALDNGLRNACKRKYVSVRQRASAYKSRLGDFYLIAFNGSLCHRASRILERFIRIEILPSQHQVIWVNVKLWLACGG